MLKVIQICDVSMCKCFKSAPFHRQLVYIYYHNVKHIDEHKCNRPSVPCSEWSESS